MTAPAKVRAIFRDFADWLRDMERDVSADAVERLLPLLTDDDCVRIALSMSEVL